MRTHRLLTTALIAVTVALAGCGETAGAGLHAGTATPQHRSQGDRAEAKGKRHAAETVPRAITAAAVLVVKGRAAKTGYSREQFGDGGIDIGGRENLDRIRVR